MPSGARKCLDEISGDLSIRVLCEMSFAIHVTKAGTDGDYQHLPEIVERAIAGSSWVFKLIKAVHQTEASMA